MTNAKTLKTRLIQKHDIEANWLLATNFAPLKGELIIYDADENYDYCRFKVGDGITNINDLEFFQLNVEYLVQDNMFELGGGTAEALGIGHIIEGEIDLSNYYTKEESNNLYATKAQVGDIETALDAIIAIQNELIGG